jgi:hypothetical protein
MRAEQELRRLALLADTDAVAQWLQKLAADDEKSGRGSAIPAAAGTKSETRQVYPTKFAQRRGRRSRA